MAELLTNFFGFVCEKLFFNHLPRFQETKDVLIWARDENVLLRNCRLLSLRPWWQFVLRLILLDVFQLLGWLQDLRFLNLVSPRVLGSLNSLSVDTKSLSTGRISRNWLLNGEGWLLVKQTFFLAFCIYFLSPFLDSYTLLVVLLSQREYSKHLVILDTSLKLLPCLVALLSAVVDPRFLRMYGFEII